RAAPDRAAAGGLIGVAGEPGGAEPEFSLRSLGSLIRFGFFPGAGHLQGDEGDGCRGVLFPGPSCPVCAGGGARASGSGAYRHPRPAAPAAPPPNAPPPAQTGQDYVRSQRGVSVTVVSPCVGGNP